MRVLIAEDETIIRLDLRGLLEKHGMVVCGEARDGAEAVELARQLEPDVCVLDLRMPMLDGIEAARRIRAERPTPIVMLTAVARHEELLRARRALGARPPKPVELDLPSTSGHVWPVRLRRDENGVVQVEAGS